MRQEDPWIDWRVPEKRTWILPHAPKNTTAHRQSLPGGRRAGLKTTADSAFKRFQCPCSELKGTNSVLRWQIVLLRQQQQRIISRVSCPNTKPVSRAPKEVTLTTPHFMHNEEKHVLVGYLQILPGTIPRFGMRRKSRKSSHDSLGDQFREESI